VVSDFGGGNVILPMQPSGYRLGHPREVVARAIQMAIVAHRYDSPGLRDAIREFSTVARRSGLGGDDVAVALYDVVNAEPILRFTVWERSALMERLANWAAEDFEASEPRGESGRRLTHPASPGTAH
jgi:hypothetical protein